MVIPAALGMLGAFALNQFSTVVAVIVGQTVSPALAPIADKAQQAAYDLAQTRRIPIGDAVTLRYMGFMTKVEYYRELEVQGYDKDRSDLFYSAGMSLLDAMTLIRLKRRELIKDKEFYDRAEQIRWERSNIDALVKATEVIPSATDIITFAVREVYTPEIAEAFGQYEGAQEVFTKAQTDIEAIGMSYDTFVKYWAAHWALPSVGQGFEMLHRGVIPYTATPAEPLSLERLMIALDIMPAWRDKLKEISYSPYTRVDVRRMHLLGILEDADLIRAYKDLGYDDVKAGNMAEFTIKYNEQVAKDATKPERDLTKAEVLAGFKKRLLTEVETREFLGALGYAGLEVDFFIALNSLQQVAEERELSISYIKSLYVKDIITYSDVVSELGKLDLPAKQQEWLLSLWDLEREHKERKPSLTALKDFYKMGLITVDELKVEIMSLGYNEYYAEMYLAQIEKKATVSE